MTTPARSRGFTIVEVLIVVVMSGVLVAIGVPNLLRAQKRAKHSEAVTHLKSLHASLSTQSVKPTSIHVPGFHPQRGNRYSYHLGSCVSYEDRSTQHAVKHAADDCIGADSFADPALPNLFTLMLIPGVSWDDQALMNGMGATPGIFGSESNWDYLAYAAGDLDGDPSDASDTWAVASADGMMFPLCPTPPEYIVNVTAGEPFLVNEDPNPACNWSP
jgi:type IV pilus assembly protein PilA